MKFNSALRRLIALGATVVVGSTTGAAAADLVLSNGRTLISARIVMIGDAKMKVAEVKCKAAAEICNETCFGVPKVWPACIQTRKAP